MAKPRNKPKAIVTAVLPGAPHPFKGLEAEGKLPVLKSIGYVRKAPGSRDYVSYVITSQGAEVLGIECSEPNLKPIASDEAKINFVTLFEDADQTLEEDLKHIAAEENRA